jgi:hypothetical protein
MQQLMANGLDGSRQSELIPTDTLAMRATVIGAGAIGSNVVPMLVRTGFTEVLLYDDDLLQSENVGGGLFDARMIGKPKVRSVATLGHTISGVKVVTPIMQVFADQQVDTPFVFIGVDSIEVRVQLIPLFFAMEHVKVIVDGRIGGHSTMVYTIDKRAEDGGATALERVMKTLTVEPLPLPCGQKATAYNTLLCAGFMGGAVARALNNLPPTFMQYSEGDSGMLLTVK